MLINLIYVGLGGAAGAVMRYLISLLPLKSSFPLLTLVTNLLGAMLIAVSYTHLTLPTICSV